MKQRFLWMAALALAVSVSSCKKEDATSKIDPNAKDVPAATGEPHMSGEPTIGGPGNIPAPEKPKDGKYPQFAFDRTEHDFGTIKQGDKVSTVFKFTNTGSADLIISNAVGSCGCTVPEYPKDPVKPGAAGEIKVSFNSANKKGQQSKTVTLYANTVTGQEKLTIKSEVQE